MASLGVVALFNSAPDAIALITRPLESAGFAVVPVLIPEVRQGRCDLEALMARHDPSVVVYDIGSPYQDNWMMFQELRAIPSMRNRRYVITSLNTRQVEQLAGRDERIYELVDQPNDLDAIVQAVKEAAHTRSILVPAEAPAPRSNVRQMAERRFQSDRRQAWTSDDIYRKLREKSEEVETDRRSRGRRASDGPHSHAA
jgi:response regulator RpfG family c-di-GMP phosphodiesterase